MPSITTNVVDASALVALLAPARRTGLTGYDAGYLLVARMPGVELVTLDRKLDAAARRTK